jgi:hypothetical protein
MGGDYSAMPKTLHLVATPQNREEPKYFEENRYLSSQFSDFGFSWEIHPAYRWALQPDTIHDIFQNLDLSIDDD